MALQEEMRDWHVDPHAAVLLVAQHAIGERVKRIYAHIKPITVEEKALAWADTEVMDPKDRNMDVQAVLPCEVRKGEKSHSRPLSNLKGLELSAEQNTDVCQIRIAAFRVSPPASTEGSMP
jgi:hypothetical protein